MSKQEVKEVELSEQEKRIEKKVEELVAKFLELDVTPEALKGFITEAVKSGFDLLPAQKVIDIHLAAAEGGTDAWRQKEPSDKYRVGTNEWKAYCYQYDRSKNDLIGYTSYVLEVPEYK